jgi:sec-independent protein translocase protein TatA
VGSGLLTPGHLVVLLVIALLVFGPKRLPELGRSLGSGMRGFKKAIESDDDDEPESIAEQPDPDKKTSAPVS